MTVADAVMAELVRDVEHALDHWFDGNVVRTEHELRLECELPGARIALADLAAVAGYPGREWEQRATELTYMSLAAAERGAPYPSVYEAHRPLLRSMLVSPAALLTAMMFGGSDDDAVPVGRPIADGLLEIAAVACGPFGPRHVRPSEVSRWGVPLDRVLADCRANIDDEDGQWCRTVVEQGLPFHDLVDDGYRIGATVALRPDAVDRESAPELGPLGAFLTVPEMNFLRLHPILTRASLGAPAVLAEFAASRFDAAENELSPRVYHWRDGELNAVELVVDADGRRRLAERHRALAAGIAALPDRG